MNPLKPLDMTTLRDLLNLRLSVLRDEVEAAGVLRRETADATDREVVDRKDEAHRQQLAEMNGAQEERDRDEIARIEAALHRLSAGDYGLCLDCREPIVLPRLMAQPQAQRCALCQLSHERAQLRSR
jgi:DnaK suppressor protein